MTKAREKLVFSPPIHEPDFSLLSKIEERMRLDALREKKWIKHGNYLKTDILARLSVQP